jgi:tetratricopeptide (TPR) repeat protein
LTQLFALMRGARYGELETQARALMGRHGNCGLLWKLLGVSLWLQGKQAVQALETAARLAPGDAETHTNLGNVLRAAGRLEEAAASHRRAIAMRPDYTEAHNNLGSVLLDLGRLDEAAIQYRRALALKPDFALAHDNLGIALLGLGRAVEAANSHLQALRLNPDSADAHVHLAHAQYALGRLPEAVASYRRALDLNPQAAETHNNLGNALLELGRPEEAAECYHRAVEIKPAFAKAHSNLGSAYRALWRLDEAEASIRRALDLAPDSAEMYLNLGIVQRLKGRAADAQASARRALGINPSSAASLVLLGELDADRGRFAEAESSYGRALSIDPDAAQAWAGIAAIRKMTREDAGWLAETRRLADSGLKPRDEMLLRYALGKYFDDLEEFEPAFGHYQRANELAKGSQPPHDRELLSRSLDRIIELYGEAWVRQPREHAAVSPRPVFIVGMPRSGTSLAEQILASHPAVFGAGELPFWNGASTGVSSALLEGAFGESRLNDTAEAYLGLLRELAPNARRVIDKMPGNFAFLGLMHAALPRARIIHIRRHPIDTCLSIYFQNFHLVHSYANDLGDLAHYYGEYLRIMEHWRAILPAQTLLEVRYEDLVEDLPGWSRRMIDFIGLEWDAACIDFHRTSRSVSTFSKWQVRQKINKSSVERWRNYAPFVGPLAALTAGQPR